MEYRLIRSDRKTISITIEKDGTVLVRAPRYASRASIEGFLSEKEDWISKHVAKQKERLVLNESVDKLSYDELKRLAGITGELITPMLREYSKILNVKYARVTIRAQHTRWGSCTSDGNLNFNCLLAMVPENVVRYVVVHELCHRLEMNHSERFWALVGSVLPDYKAYRKWLKENGSVLIARLP